MNRESRMKKEVTRPLIRMSVVSPVDRHPGQGGVWHDGLSHAPPVNAAKGLILRSGGSSGILA